LKNIEEKDVQEGTYLIYFSNKNKK